MKRTVTIKSNCDFRRTYGKGKSFQAPALVSYVLKNRAGICRVGITTSKKIGNAVERNRARRVIRVAYSNLESKIQGNYDIVFVTDIVKARIYFKMRRNTPWKSMPS